MIIPSAQATLKRVEFIKSLAARFSKVFEHDSPANNEVSIK